MNRSIVDNCSYSSKKTENRRKITDDWW